VTFQPNRLWIHSIHMFHNPGLVSPPTGILRRTTAVGYISFRPTRPLLLLCSATAAPEYFPNEWRADVVADGVWMRSPCLQNAFKAGANDTLSAWRSEWTLLPQLQGQAVILNVHSQMITCCVLSEQLQHLGNE